MPYLYFLRLSLILVVLIGSTLLTPQPTVAQPEGELYSSEGETMKPRMGSSSFYNESWTYHIMLDNDVYIIYTFNIADFGTFKSRATGAKYQVTWTDGNTYLVRKEYDPEDFIYDSNSNYIRLHPERTYWARGSFDDIHKLNYDAGKDGVDYLTQLELYDIADSQIWGDGNFSVNGREISLSFPVPHAKVRGMVALNDDTLRDVSGVAFMEHTHITDKVTDLFNKGYRFKFGNSQNGMVAHFIKTRDSGKIVGYGIKYVDGRPQLVHPTKLEEVETDRIRGMQYGRKLIVHFQEVDPVTITVDEVYKDYSILDELGGIQKFFAKRVLGGEMVEFNGTGYTAQQQEVMFNYYVVE